MGHDHAAHDHGGYYVDQLCSLAACAALAVISVYLHVSGQLEFLAPEFRAPVLYGGLALLVLVFIRGVTLWYQVGRTVAHMHDHSHDGHQHTEECDHEHTAACDHDHSQDCGHDHAGVPIRYAVLVLPIIAFPLFLGGGGLSAKAAIRNMAQGATEDKQVAAKGGGTIALTLRDVQQTSYSPEKRAALEGRKVRIKGMFAQIDAQRFSLFKMRITHCVADAIVMDCRIISTVPLTKYRDKDWVSVEGQIEFHKLVGRDKYVPIIRLTNEADIDFTEPDASEYDYS